MQAWLLWSGTLPTLQTAEAHGQEHTEQPWEGSASRGGFPQLSGGGAATWKPSWKQNLGQCSRLMLNGALTTPRHRSKRVTHVNALNPHSSPLN